MEETMNKLGRGMYFCFIAMTVLVCGAWAGGFRVQAAVSEKEQIKAEVKKKLSGKDVINKVYYLDYDKNGRKEAFLLTGVSAKNSDYEEGLPNTLWFGYCSGDKVKIKVIARNVVLSAHTLKLKSETFFCAGRYVTTSYPENMYQVKGNSVKKIFQGSSIAKDRGNTFTSVHSTYDNNTDGSGHTEKPYYYYYKNGRVYQYKAKKISLKKLKKYKGASQYLKQIKKTGYQVTSVLYRSNGLIHLNIKSRGSCENVTLKVKGKNVSLVVINKKGRDIINKSSYGGIYKKVL